MRLHAVLFASLCVLLPLCVPAQNANDGYLAYADAKVQSIVIQPDGKAIVGGAFSAINGQTCHALCRLNVDGSPDVAFPDPVIVGSVTAIALQPDGKILIGGSFTKIGTQTRNYLARLNNDGTFDASFGDPNLANPVLSVNLQADGAVLVSLQTTPTELARYDATGAPDPTFSAAIGSVTAVVSAVILQPDGRILLGGSFATVNGTPCPYLCRLLSNGSIDVGFTYGNSANPNPVSSIGLQGDGRVVYGSHGCAIGYGGPTGICRLNADGSKDSSFYAPDSSYPTQQNRSATSIAIQADGKVVFVAPSGVGSLILRLMPSGASDYAFAQGAISTDLTVNALAVQPSDNKILFGGDFTSFYNQIHLHLARLDSSGFPEESMSAATPNNFVNAIALQPDSNILVGGEFTWMAGQVCPSICRLRSNGYSDYLAPNGYGVVSAVALQTDGKILAVGDLSGFGGLIGQNIFRLNANGSTDASFIPPLAAINVVLQQPDGKLLIAGYFTTVNQQTQHRLAKLNGDGSIDPTFADPNADGDIYTIALQPDGKILAGGSFINIGTPPRQRPSIARFNADGTVDNSFVGPTLSTNVAGTYGFVAAIASLPDGKILIAGDFTSPAGYFLARLNADGSLDPAFVDPNLDGNLYALALQTDGRILIGGVFKNVGTPPQPKNYLARLNADGSVDGSFSNPNASSFVLALALQVDGKILAGGNFNFIGAPAPLPRQYFARLSGPDAALQSINVSANLSTVTWMRSGTSPELALPPILQYSTDGLTYSDIGVMARIPGGWVRTGVPSPNVVGQPYYLRARARVSGGEWNGSQGLIESVRIAYGSDLIFANGFEL